MPTQYNNLMSSLISRELIFTIGFSAIASLVSDFLQPLGNITFFLFLFSVLSVVVIGFLYFIKKIYRGKLFKFLVASLVIMFISGFLYSSQDELNADNCVLASNVGQIKELLDSRVRPAVAQDGGDITFHGFDRGVVYLQMKGACAGCPSSTMTLKMGIENLLRHYIPEVTEVRPVDL